MSFDVRTAEPPLAQALVLANRENAEVSKMRPRGWLHVLVEELAVVMLMTMTRKLGLLPQDQVLRRRRIWR